MLTFSCLHSHNSNPERPKHLYTLSIPQKFLPKDSWFLPHPKEKQSWVVKTKHTLCAKSNVTPVTQASATETTQNPLTSVPQKE